MQHAVCFTDIIKLENWYLLFNYFYNSRP